MSERPSRRRVTDDGMQNVADAYRMSRDQVRRKVPCPRCGAAVGEPCVNQYRKQRIPNHIERIHAALPEALHGVLASGGNLRAKAMRDRQRIPHAVVRTVACPQCGVAAGEPCLDADGVPRRANHVLRVKAAIAATSF